MKVAAGLLAGILLIAASVSPRVTRNTLVTMERLADRRLASWTRTVRQRCSV